MGASCMKCLILAGQSGPSLYNQMEFSIIKYYFSICLGNLLLLLVDSSTMLVWSVPSRCVSIIPLLFLIPENQVHRWTVHPLGSLNCPTFLRKLSQLTSSPLWPIAKAPCWVCTTKGWQLTASEAAAVEYRVWPIPKLPFSFFIESSVKILLIIPIPLWTLKFFAHFPADVTIPADSWPRCCNATSPKQITCAISTWNCS